MTVDVLFSHGFMNEKKKQTRKKSIFLEQIPFIRQMADDLNSLLPAAAITAIITKTIKVAQVVASKFSVCLAFYVIAVNPT